MFATDCKWSEEDSDRDKEKNGVPVREVVEEKAGDRKGSSKEAIGRVDATCIDRQFFRANSVGSTSVTSVLVSRFTGTECTIVRSCHHLMVRKMHSS